MWKDLNWCNDNSSPSACRWCKRGQKNNALGRSRGGFSTKIHFAVSKNGYPLRFRITPGQAADIHDIIPLLAQRAPDFVIADTAYDSDRTRAVISGWGCEIVIANRPQRNAPFPLDKEMYKKRSAVEIFIIGMTKRKNPTPLWLRSDASELLLDFENTPQYSVICLYSPEGRKNWYDVWVLANSKLLNMKLSWWLHFSCSLIRLYVCENTTFIWSSCKGTFRCIIC